jgi:hypothetical protein
MIHNDIESEIELKEAIPLGASAGELEDAVVN